MSDLDEEDLDLGRLLSATDAENELGIPAGTVRSWWNRGREGMQLGGLDAVRNRPLFWECDLLALARGEPIRDIRGRRILTMNEVREWRS